MSVTLRPYISLSLPHSFFLGKMSDTGVIAIAEMLKFNETLTVLG
jgi:hypothetical protein